jgi:hypothetical protein
MSQLVYTFPTGYPDWLWTWADPSETPAVRGAVQSAEGSRPRPDPPISNRRGGLRVTITKRGSSEPQISRWSRIFTPLELGVPAGAKVKRINLDYRYKWRAATRSKRQDAIDYAALNYFRSLGENHWSGPCQLLKDNAFLGEFSGKFYCPPRHENDDGTNCWLSKPEGGDDTVGASDRAWFVAAGSEIAVDLVAEDVLQIRLFNFLNRLFSVLNDPSPDIGRYWLQLRITEVTLTFDYDEFNPAGILSSDDSKTMQTESDGETTIAENQTDSATEMRPLETDLSTSFREV